MAELEYLQALPTPELSSMLDNIRESDTAGSLRILNLIAERAEEAKEYESICKWQEEIIEIAEEINDPETQALALTKYGRALFYLDRELEAIGKYQQARHLYEAAFDDRRLLNCLVEVIDCYVYLDQQKCIIETAESALRIARILEENKISGDMAMCLSDAYYQIGKNEDLDVLSENHTISLEYAEEALQYFQTTGDVHDIARATIEACDTLNYLGRYTEVDARISEAIAALEDADSDKSSLVTKSLLAKCHRLKGQILGNQGLHDEALKSLTSAHGVLEGEDDNFQSLAIIHWAKSDNYEALGDSKLAIEEIQLAMSFADKMHSRELYFEIMDNLIKLLYSNDRDMEALFLSRGAMFEYEQNEQSQMPSPTYFEFIIRASLCLHRLRRWQELLGLLDKVENLRNFSIPVSKAVRIDALKAEGNFRLGNEAQALEILDSILNFGEIDHKDEDFGDSLIIRAILISGMNPLSAKEDLELGISILTGIGRQSKVDRFLEEFPVLKSLIL
jgi:tetratricopeptide (TPR) repeat protein